MRTYRAGASTETRVIVRFICDRERDRRVWVASWKEDGESHRLEFSTTEFGYAGAQQRALAARQQITQRLASRAPCSVQQPNGVASAPAAPHRGMSLRNMVEIALEEETNG